MHTRPCWCVRTSQNPHPIPHRRASCLPQDNGVDFPVRSPEDAVPLEIPEEAAGPSNDYSEEDRAAIARAMAEMASEEQAQQQPAPQLGGHRSRSSARVWPRSTNMGCGALESHCCTTWCPASGSCRAATQGVEAYIPAQGTDPHRVHSTSHHRVHSTGQRARHRPWHKARIHADVWHARLCWRGWASSGTCACKHK
jgi:hypothetical protein